ncbi:MAG: sodium/proline symporter [Candidatus Krumholzibacteria bacterium]|jgi:sodium/proline symporter|nr:sodium/proline symporter [Candidatus Krumholzibacteria bacterium]
MECQAQLLAVVAGYFLLLIAWGIYQGRKVKNDADYLIAGRNLPGWAAALSERATGESSWALLGLPGAAYATGLVEIWTAIGCVAGIITAWAAIAWRLRDEAEKYRVNSFIEYISCRHSESGRWLRVAGSATIVFFFFFYVGAQFLGGGKTLHAMFGIAPKFGLLITALIIVPYTVYGGFRSVVYTDVIQAIVMITTLIVGPIVGVIAIMHMPGIFANSIPEALSRAGGGYLSLTGASGGFAAGIVIAGGFSWFFGYLGGQPQLSVRFMAIRDPGQARKGRNIGIAWTLIAYIGALSIGWIGLALFGPGGLKDPEYVMPAVMLKLFPPAIAAVLITGAIAAMISTADSLLILSAGELSENIIKPLLNRNWSCRVDSSRRAGGATSGCAGTGAKNRDSGRGGRDLALSRLVTGALAAVALALAYLFPSTLIYTMVSYVWAGIGGTFSVVILLTLFWKRYSGKAALVTIAAGMFFTIAWIATGMDRVVTARLMTFLVAGASALVAGMIFRAPARDIDPGCRG